MQNRPDDFDLSPMDELELAEIRAGHAFLDEEQTMFDPDEHPKPPHSVEEGVTDLDGEREVDVMTDTTPVDVLTLTGVLPEPHRDVDL